MSWRAYVQKKQRILFTNRIGRVQLLKQFPRIVKLRFKLALYFMANFVTALVDAWANRRQHVGRLCAIFSPHHAQPFLDDALECSSPAGMKSTDCPVLCVN